ncbi:hypothetical protein GLOIN_2v1778277 [Rhizophagus irregularis DAOM 181602=DAOM 197198]|nr:hypothetical protein GLOIN_2v1778277 [Rhizophagus irregularis DAOM 181602=DAOM 197198]
MLTNTSNNAKNKEEADNGQYYYPQLSSHRSSGSIPREIQQCKTTGQGPGDEEIFPYELISSHFQQQPPNNSIHIVVYI